MAAILCQSVSRGCEGITRCCSGPLEALSRTVGQACCSPFFPYLALTCGLNIAPVVWGGKAFLNMKACDHTQWLWINALGALANVLGSFWIAGRIQSDVLFPGSSSSSTSTFRSTGNTTTVEPVDTEAPVVKVTNNDKSSARAAEPQTFSYYRRIENVNGTVQSFTYATASKGADTSANSLSRLWYVLCWDMGVALYLVIAVAWMVWQSIGFSRLAFHQNNNDAEYENVACDMVDRWAIHSVTMGFCYMTFVCVAFTCSLCCLR